MRDHIVLISAPVGDGHDGAARELGDRLARHGFEVRRLNLLDATPGRLGSLVSGGYRLVLRVAPWSYQALFSLTGRWRSTGALTRFALRPLRRRLLDQLPPGTRAVVCTYPFASQVVGPLRARGELSVPVITYLTDFSVHPLWVAPGVDLHCAVHEQPRRAADLHGAGATRTVRPLVSAAFRPGSPAARRRARERFGLPADARLALLVAGSWGTGKVGRSAIEIARSGTVLPVVVCGRNRRLRERLSRRLPYVLGWVDDMPTLMDAVDVVVENAGGLTTLEALACGLPVVTYRPIPGHGRSNADALDAAGAARLVDRPEALAGTLRTLVENRSEVWRPDGIDAAAAVARLALSASPLRDRAETRRESRLRRLATVVGALSRPGRHEQSRPRGPDRHDGTGRDRWPATG